MPSPSDPLPPSPSDAPLPPLLPDAALVQRILDGEHLRLLSIFHYVVGGLAILFSSLFIIHIFFGVMMLRNPRFFDSPPLQHDTLSSPAPTASPDETAPAPVESTPAARPAHRPTLHGEGPPAFFGYVIVGIGSLAVLLGWTIGTLLIYSGRCLARRTRRVFSMVIAGISCLQVPFGTILGVFTLVALQRPSVKALYAASAQERKSDGV